MTAIKIAFKEIQKREAISCVIYTDFQSSMQLIQYNEENHPILNQIYNILVELRALNKQIILF